MFNLGIINVVNLGAAYVVLRLVSADYGKYLRLQFPTENLTGFSLRQDCTQ